MFQWDTMEGRSRRRFWALVAASVAAHVALFFGGLGLGAVRAARDLSLFRWDSDESYTNQIKVAQASMAPLKYPTGFFAVKEPPKEIVRREELPKPRPAPENPEEKQKEPEPKREDVADGTGGEAASEKPGAEQAQAPDGPQKFGVIKANALRPHIKAAYAAYEAGTIPDGPFRVTVTCSVAPDGSLADIRLAKSSGSELIDETALNLFRELSAMRAMQPLAGMSSLSLTLERGASASTLTAVGFAKDEQQAQGLAFTLSTTKQLKSWTAKNADEAALINSTQIAQTGNRISVSCTLPNSRAGDMMRRSFGSDDAAAAAARKPSA